MKMLHALLDGLRRAGRAWRLLLGLWLVNLLVALPFALALTQELGADLGRSAIQMEDDGDELVLDPALDLGWLGELDARTGGLVDTFGPEILGAGAFFENLESWWRGDLLDGPPLLVGAGLLYALVWTFLLGGVLERLAWLGGRVAARERAAGFFAGCGRHFSRFLVLALLAGVFYYFVYSLSRWGFGALEEAMLDVTSERTVLLWVIPLTALVILLLSVVRVIFDYAKIAIVADDRGNLLFATLQGLARGIRFVAAHPVSTLGLYWLIGLVGVLLLGLYSAIAPVTGGASWPVVLLFFVVGQLALVGKIALRLVTLASETALYSPASAHPQGSAATPARERRPVIAS